MAKTEELKKCTVGGQGVLEGVMMRSPTHSALAVRRPTGEISTKEWDNKQRKGKFVKLPVVRGVVNFIDMMMMGVSTITDAAKLYDENDTESFEPSRFEKFVAKKTGRNAMDVMMVFAVVLGLALAVGLFFVLPTLISNFIGKHIEASIVKNLIEGGVRLVIFLGYMLLVSCVGEIKRMFRYHGAEHKTIACFEAGEELTVENVRKHRRLHPRCGTSYMLLVIVISILIYAVFGWTDNFFLRLATRLLMLPIIAGVSYELLKLFAAHENAFCRAVRWPGLQLQRLTTAEPDDGMMECAITAFEMALQEKSAEELKEMVASFDRSEKKAKSAAEEEAEEPAEDAAEESGAGTAPAEAEADDQA